MSARSEALSEAARIARDVARDLADRLGDLAAVGANEAAHAIELAALEAKWADR